MVTASRLDTSSGPSDASRARSNARESARKAFQAADDAWGDELRRLFGKRAGDVRYTVQGKGEAGSTLRGLHDAQVAAAAAWTLACQVAR
jgi:hypothetical protein